MVCLQMLVPMVAEEGEDATLPEKVPLMAREEALKREVLQTERGSQE